MKVKEGRGGGQTGVRYIEVREGRGGRQVLDI